MIQRLELRHWRAFDHVAIDFEPGTTFLVAPNGVGKTSLLLGLTWALFGDHTSVDAKASVRIGHDNAHATVAITVTDARELVISRTVTTTGKTTSTYSLDGQELDETEANRMLADEFGAPIDIAARLAVIRGSGNDDGELQLREHLYDAFGVSGLRRAAASAAKVHKDAVAARKKLRSASRTQLANREQLVVLADKLRDDLSELATQRAPLAVAVAEAESAKQATALWADYDSRSATRSGAVADLLAEAADHGHRAANLEELASTVLDAITALDAASVGAQTVVDDARAQALAARAALALLEAHDPSCPTCARPFHGDELVAATATQSDSLALGEARIEAARSELQRNATEKLVLDSLRSRAVALMVPIAEPGPQRPERDPEADVAAAQEAVRRHDELTGSITSERSAIVASLGNDDEAQAAYEAERVAWKKEALAQAAATALNGTAERLANEYIEPLSQQVRWRWKALFGDDGLQLRPDGTIVRVVGERELSWSQLSSGEQIWARLVASLLVLRSSTKVPFAWLDEPLEHLDPRARRIVATDLAASTRTGRPAQLIITTYEHTLARQLAEDMPATHLRQINRSDKLDLPPRRWADEPLAERDLTPPGSAHPAA